MEYKNTLTSRSFFSTFIKLTTFCLFIMTLCIGGNCNRELKFTKVQDISPDFNNINDWEFFAINGNYYLAADRLRDEGGKWLWAEGSPGVLCSEGGEAYYGNKPSIIYQYDFRSHNFYEIQSIRSEGFYCGEFFTIGDEFYLVGGSVPVFRENARVRSANESTIYRWDNVRRRFIDPEPVPGTSNIVDCEFFSIDGEHFLCVANSTADSIIYKWNGSIFKFFHTIPMHANDIDFLPSIAGSQLNGWLVVANKNDSKIYEWRKAESPFLAEFQEIPASKDRRFEHYGTRECEVFTIGNTHYIASANLGAESKIYAKKSSLT